MVAREGGQPRGRNVLIIEYIQEIAVKFNHYGSFLGFG
jgi:hypothetical protein